MKRKKNSFDKKIFVFLIKFFLIFFILNTIISFLDFQWLNNFVAVVVATISFSTSISSIVFVGQQQFIITNYCLGFVSIAMLAALIFSLSKPDIRKKFVVFVLGAIILFILNIFRIVMVLFSAKIGFDAQLMHTLSWFLMSAFVLLIWFYLMLFFSKKKMLSDLL